MGSTTTMPSPVAVPPGGAALADAVTRGPDDPVVATVTGPGGTGKTLLLDALEERWRAVGVPVLRAGPAVPVPGDATGAVLVDDAHLLDVAALHGLRALADVDGTRLVLAHRPWPRPSALAAFIAEVGARRRVAVVGHLDHAEVADRLGLRWGRPSPDALTAWVLDRSGGLPVLVDLVTQGLLDAGRFDPRSPERFRPPERVTVSAALAERLRHRVDALPVPVQELLSALAHGAPLDHDVLGELLGPDGEPAGGQVRAAPLVDTVEAARATGLLTPAGDLIPVIAELFLRLTPVLSGRDLHRRLAAIELRRGGPVLEAGRRLLGAGATGAEVAEVFGAAAAEATDPGLTARLLGAAVDAGHPRAAVAGRRALALVLAGELGPALQEADVVLCDPAAPDRPAALTAAAVALTHRGLPERAIDLLRADPACAPLAAPALAMLGRVDEARAVAAPAGTTLRDGAVALFGVAAVAAATGCPSAPARLVRVTTLLDPVAATTALPDTPAALTAVVALLANRRGLAESTLRHAIEHRHGGRVAVLRHRLLLGWVLLTGGSPGPATALLTRLPAGLEPRDALLAAALDVALARRRDDDAAGLGTAWAAARDALVRQPVDLTAVPVLAELVVAAAVLGEEFWVAGPLAELDAVLDALGRPAPWDVPLAWGRLQAALVTGDTGAVRRHAAVLDAGAGSSPHAAVLAAAAATWIAVLDGATVMDDVLCVGRRMGAAGLTTEAAQLAAAAAATVDRRAAHQLHALARTLTGRPDGDGDGPAEPVPAGPDSPGVSPPEAAPAPTAPAPTAVDLTEREREIGRLLLDGLTHKQVGQRLFISPKTVEHYVAAMRRRLGARSRDELFALLRAASG